MVWVGFEVLEKQLWRARVEAPNYRETLRPGGRWGAKVATIQVVTAQLIPWWRSGLSWAEAPKQPWLPQKCSSITRGERLMRFLYGQYWVYNEIIVREKLFITWWATILSRTRAWGVQIVGARFFLCVVHWEAVGDSSTEKFTCKNWNFLEPPMPVKYFVK